jgi:hypothetical protein
VQPAPAVSAAQDNKEDNKAPVGASPVSTSEPAPAPGSATASPLPSVEVLAAAQSIPGKSIPAPVAGKTSNSAGDVAAKPASEFVPVAPLE